VFLEVLQWPSAAGAVRVGVESVGGIVRLVLVGPPGAGKGTQAVLLAERLGVPHISTGDLFRANLGSMTPLGVEAKRYMDAGDLVPDDVTCRMVEARLSEPDAAKGFILDGFPRTLPQSDQLDAMLNELGVTLDAVVEFAVSDEVVVERLLGRGRSDDTEDVIRNRQKVYRDETAPLLDHYRAQLVSVDAVGAVDEVAQRLADALPEA
jgi:adenylate kinase